MILLCLGTRHVQPISMSEMSSNSWLVKSMYVLLDLLFKGLIITWLSSRIKCVGVIEIIWYLEPGEFHYLTITVVGNTAQVLKFNFMLHLFLCHCLFYDTQTCMSALPFLHINMWKDRNVQIDILIPNFQHLLKNLELIVACRYLPISIIKQWIGSRGG